MWGHKKDNQKLELIHGLEAKQDIMQNALGDDRRGIKDARSDLKELHDYTIFLLKHPEVEFKKRTGWLEPSPTRLFVKVDGDAIAKIEYDSTDFVYDSDKCQTVYQDVEVTFLKSYKPDGKSFIEQNKNYGKLKDQLERFSQFILQDFLED